MTMSLCYYQNFLESETVETGVDRAVESKYLQISEQLMDPTKELQTVCS